MQCEIEHQNDSYKL